MAETPPIARAQLLLRCPDLTASLAFYRERLGLRLDWIRPADDPRDARVSGHGLQLHLQRGESSDPPIELELATDTETDTEPLRAPEGTRIRWVPATPPLAIPPLHPETIVTSYCDDDWVTGRAGMQYRDLLPGRLGGHLIASHIRIPGRGPVPDDVHFHQVRFQLIYCLKGSVELVYEDQGDPFTMRAGDCVLQPPGIRHRVLYSEDLEVLEVGCPAEHDTFLDHDMKLPNGKGDPARRWEGQAFHLHVAAEAEWVTEEGVHRRDSGLLEASGGAVGLDVLQSTKPCTWNPPQAGPYLAYVVRGRPLGHPAGTCALVAREAQEGLELQGSSEVVLVQWA